MKQESNRPAKDNFTKGYVISVIIIVALFAIIGQAGCTENVMTTNTWYNQIQSTRLFFPNVFNGKLTSTSTVTPVTTKTPTQTKTATSVSNTPTPDNLLFSDEFNNQEVDEDKWSKQYPWGGTISENGELEYYVDDGFDFTSTALRLKGEKQTVYIEDYGTFNYTSGMISSYEHFVFTYGYIEIRARLPEGQGLWPAFWMVADADVWPPEIDIFEVLGQTPSTVYMTNWYGTEYNPLKTQFTYTGVDTSDGFHIYALDWQAGRLTWYIDGIQRAVVTQHVPSQDMCIIANLAIGGDWPGSPNASTTFPAYYDIDYIRVYTSKP